MIPIRHGPTSTIRRSGSNRAMSACPHCHAPRGRAAPAVAGVPGHRASSNRPRAGCDRPCASRPRRGMADPARGRACAYPQAHRSSAVSSRRAARVAAGGGSGGSASYPPPSAVDPARYRRPIRTLLLRTVRGSGGPIRSTKPPREVLSAICRSYWSTEVPCSGSCHPIIPRRHDILPFRRACPPTDTGWVLSRHIPSALQYSALSTQYSERPKGAIHGIRIVLRYCLEVRPPGVEETRWIGAA